LAKKSVDYGCAACCGSGGKCSDILKKIELRIKSRGKEGDGAVQKKSRFQKEIEQLHALQMVNHVIDADDDEKDEGKKDGKDDDAVSGDKEGSDEKMETAAGEKEHVSETVSTLASEEETKTESASIDAAKIEEAEVAEKEQATTSTTKPEEQILCGIITNDDSAAASSEIVDAAEEKKPLPELKVVEKDTTTNVASEMDQHANANATTTQIDDERTENVEAMLYDDSDEDENGIERRLQSPLLSDPVVHAGIVIFSIIVWMLVRKLTAIIEDMKELEAQFREV